MFFFFQAEDGIRDIGVTGVQTCALPIYCRGGGCCRRAPHPSQWSHRAQLTRSDAVGVPSRRACRHGAPVGGRRPGGIGRASCRERVEILGVAVSLKKKNRDKYKLRSSRE